MSTLELKEEVLSELSSYLEKTLSPDPNIRRPAEKYLELNECRENYGPLLLFLCNQQELPMHLRVVASVTFKNFVKRQWKISEENEVPDKVSGNDRLAIKASIIELMLTSPEQIQRQLSDAISLIAAEDFPEKWPDLLDGMIERMKSGNFHIINGALRTAHSIFKRYRHEFQSNELWSEIKYVLSKFALPLTELFQMVIGLIEPNANSAETIKLIFSCLVLITKIFRSLNSQDFPEEFEDTMEPWMTHFHTLILYDNPLLHTTGEEPGLLEQLKSHICDNISLFAQNYSENFADYMPNFVTAVWNLLITVGLEKKYDLLVSNAIQFITAVAYRQQYRSLFENEESLKSICEKIVIPNLFLRDIDMEMFEDNPEEYIRKDIERADTDTRRRAASDLVQALTSQFEKEVVAIFSTYVTALLQEYSTNPKKNWRQKDVVLYLVTTLASKGQTKKHGTTKASELINVVQFFETTVLPDLNDPDINNFPVLKADAMRYISTFRQQLPKEVVINTLPNLARFMSSSIPVVNTYACHAIERILTIKGVDEKENLITKNDLDPILNVLVANVLNIIAPLTGENEYAMKTLMRICIVVQERLEPYLEPILGKLISLLHAISKNPSRPNFNHYLFETFGILIRDICSKNRSLIPKFEENLFPVFNFILEQDITEFVPYSFQLLSLMLELHDQSIPAVYNELFPFILMPVLWERPGYVPALVRLLQTYIEKFANSIVTEKIMAILGIYQRLIASKVNDHYGFLILNSLTLHLPSNVLSEYMKQILLLQFQRLSGSKTTKLVKSMLVFFALFSYKYGPTKLAELVEGLQSGMFLMVLERLYATELSTITGNIDRKISAVGVIKILTEFPALLSSESNIKIWCRLMESLIGLFELPEEASKEDEQFIDVEEVPGYQANFNQLMSAKKKELDPFDGQIPNTKLFLVKQLKSMSSNVSINLTSLLSQIDGQSQGHLNNYLKGAGVSLN